MPPETAERYKALMDKEIVVRRLRTGAYEIKPRRSRMKDSVISPRQVIVDPRAQSIEVADALRPDICDDLPRRRR